MQYTPSLEEVRKSSRNAVIVPVYREVAASLDTPVSAYLKVTNSPYSFLLESVEGGDRIARYSFIGTDPEEVIKTGPGQKYGEVDPLLHLQRTLSKHNVLKIPNMGRFVGGAVGYISYDSVKYFEQLPTPESTPVDVPESVFMIIKTFLIFDHMTRRIKIVSHADLSKGVDCGYREAVERIDALAERLSGPVPMVSDPEDQVKNRDIISNISEQEYRRIVERIKQYIYQGDVIQVVPSRRMERPTSAHPLEIYKALRIINPSPYMYYLELGDFQIVGASPEMLVQVDNGMVSTRPIAGTVPRGNSEVEDIELEQRLLSDEKELAEHIMLVDLGRNDIGKVSQPGSVEVTELMSVERYSHVMHIVSHVTGRLRDDMTSYDALRSCFPAGTLSGAPKIRAMEIIAELEPDKRGPYGGAVGYFDFAGNMDTAITIRTMVIKDGVAYYQAGGGIVYDSVPEAEYEETVNKASASLRAIEQAEAGSSR